MTTSVVSTPNNDAKVDTFGPVTTLGMLVNAKLMNGADGNQLLKGNKQTDLNGPIYPESAGTQYFDKNVSNAKTTLT